MIANRGFLYVSEVGPVCDEISVCVEIVRGIAPTSGPYCFYIIAEEFSEGPCTEAALKPGDLWDERMA